MSMHAHINHTCKAAYYHLINVRRIRKYLSNEAIQSLVHTLIIGRIDYCNKILCGLPLKYVNKLQRLQNSAWRLIFNIPRFDHVTPFLRSLHWLPVKFRIEFKVVLMTFKALHGLAPRYLRDLITIKENSGYNLSSNKGLLLLQPNKTLKTLGDWAFSAASPRLWNSLPLELRNERNLSKFKSSLKTYFLRLAFY